MSPLKYESKCVLLRVSLITIAAVTSNLRSGIAQGRTADSGLVSNAVGLLAVERLVANRSLQDDLEVSPVQFIQLKKLLESEQVQKSPKRSQFDITLKASFTDEMMENEDFGVYRTFEQSVDGLVAKELLTILHVQQVDGLRQRYLRERLRFPTVALSFSWLKELDLRPSQMEEVSSRFLASSKKVEEECAQVRTKAIATLLEFLPEKSVNQFAKCFGSKNVRAVGNQESFHPSSIGLFEVDRDFRPLDVLADQERELQVKANEEFERIHRASTSDRNVDIHQEVKGALQTLATEKQYLAVFEFLHVGELEYDLRCLHQPEVLRYLEIAPELAEVIRRECDRLQNEIDTTRLQLEVPILKSVYEELAPNTRETLRWMYAGVWCDLN